MIQENISLQPFNTFGIDVKARYFDTFSSIEELATIVKQNPDKSLLILGGGSNVLFTKDVDQLVLLNQIKGFQIISEENEQVIVEAGAGEVWHEFVMKCIDLGFKGLENLSLIPGSVGASPMQNIGAYGVEIKDVFHSLDAYHISSGEIHHFNAEQCAFGYRESVFKRALKGQYIITKVRFQLTQASDSKVNTSYGAIESELEKMQITSPTIKDVSNAVIAIRSSKLPNPKEIGNAGSFFKNPVISIEHFEKLVKEFPSIPNYPAENGKKIAAGWLIEQTGWKGKRIENHGVHSLQALVLVNYGGSTGQQIYDLSTQIIEAVEQKFGITLEREVNIL